MSKGLAIGHHNIMREKFYGSIKSFWHNLNDQEYALYDILSMTNVEVEEIRLATTRIGHIFFKTAKLLRRSDEATLKQLDFPGEILPFIRHIALPVESVISRVDLVRTKDGLKVLELNADTPTFEKEVFHINNVVSKHFGMIDPNQGLESVLGKEIQKAIIECHLRTQQEHNPYVVFTSHGDHVEDKETTKYLMNLSTITTSYIPLDKLHIIKNVGLFDNEGRKIDVVYRQTYPLEHLIEDQDTPSSEKVGLQLLELVVAGKLSMINPISSFLLQSKAVQSVIWGMMELGHPFFSEEEREWIHAYFLPTYLEKDPFVTRGIRYVKKPSFGREGDTVEIFENNQMVDEDINKTYKDSLPVYQQYIDLPSHPIMTTYGRRESKLLIGSFLVNGKASGIGVRAGNQITDNNAYFLPVGIKL